MLAKAEAGGAAGFGTGWPSASSAWGVVGSGWFRIQRIKRKARLDSSGVPNMAVPRMVRTTDIATNTTTTPSTGRRTPTTTGIPAEATPVPTHRQEIRSATANVACRATGTPGALM